MSCRVGVVQMTSGPLVEPNLDVAERLIRQAVRDGAELVVLPECFAYLGPDDGLLAVAEPIPTGGPILSRFQALGRELGVELLLGGFWEQSDDPNKVCNTSIFLDKGVVRATYRKLHLFDVELPDGTTLRESDTVQAGDRPVVCETRFGKLGMSICYNVRFPELYRKLVDQGAVLLSIPAAFTLTTGKEHWHVLLRARAIESQCYVLAAAQTGHHFGRRVSFGHALIADPWGVVLAQCGEGEGVAITHLDRSVVSRVRAALPSLSHRRL